MNQWRRLQPGQHPDDGDPTEAVYQFIVEYWRAHGHTPTIRQIGESQGWRSTYTGAYHVNKLIDAGRLRRAHGHASALEILDLPSVEFTTPAGHYVRLAIARIHPADEARLAQFIDATVLGFKKR